MSNWLTEEKSYRQHSRIKLMTVDVIDDVLQLLVDDLLVFNGTLAPSKCRGGILPHTSGPISYQTVMFTHDEAIKKKVRHTTIR